ncbi:MAG: DNA-directed RNA polymerase subunit omega [Ruminococcaceae bacterium]|nr:DNA-directed RNA polymerase subunit omega [Oscillospiraceae bacterium]MBQ3599343.1 DNA-directed RNA polymerase subunit omega [Clostridia bacterium]MBR2914678.1 DNA-directed RNA polymerase subunit omega [Clostridia bacterium]
MIYPTIKEITKEKYNRYTLVIATAKSARHITDKAVAAAEKAAENADKDSKTNVEFLGEKAVTLAVDKLLTGEYKVVSAENE